jgi:cytochrome c-type biogenesis protein CcmH
LRGDFHLSLFWFLAGILSTLASLILLLPWLRKIPRLGPLPTLPWQAGVGAGLMIAAIFGLYLLFGHADLSNQTTAMAAPDAAPNPASAAAASTAAASTAAASTAGAFADAVNQSGSLSSPAPKAAAGSTGKAGSMGSAIASLERRLAKGGGSADDWELLAKSYEFLGRPADAAKARARQLPPLPPDTDETPSKPAAAAVASGTAVSGEVSLAAGLKAKAAAGATLFIVAKSVDSPGAPVAVFRSSVGTWPVKFTLDDSQSMLPGRNLSSAGRVTIEARISQSGQPLPAPGDLQGSTAAINPADHQPLKILIDRII